MKIAVSADFHLRRDRPRVRTDEDWILSQKNNVVELFRKCRDLNVDKLLLVGDILDSSNQPPWVVNIIPEAMDTVKAEGPWSVEVHIIPGNHDLQHHQYANLHNSSIGNLMRMKGVVPHGVNKKFENTDFLEEFGIVIIHRLIMPDANESLARLANAEIAADIMESFPTAEFILTGDYHKHYVEIYEDTILFNPGCLNRQSADEKNYEVGFYAFDTEDSSYGFFPLESDDVTLIDDSYLVEQHAREDSLTAYAEQLASSKGLSFDLWEVVKKLSVNSSKLVKNILEEIRTNV